MGERRSVEVAGVPEDVLDELAQSLAEKIDILLDRVTDRALAAPPAGTSAWRSQWLDRDSTAGRELQAGRLYLRAVLARRAGIGAAAPSSPAPAVTAAARSRAGRRIDADQLSMF